MPAGWRTVICEFWPSPTLPMAFRSRGEIATVARLPPGAPDPTPAELNQIEAGYVLYGGVAHASVVDMFWFGYPVLTDEQQKALAGVA
jgi:hypothetical protein